MILLWAMWNRHHALPSVVITNGLFVDDPLVTCPPLVHRNDPTSEENYKKNRMGFLGSNLCLLQYFQLVPLRLSQHMITTYG